MLRFILRLSRFGASSRLRRKALYFRITWWDFLSLKNLNDVVPPLHKRARDLQDDTDDFQHQSEISSQRYLREGQRRLGGGNTAFETVAKSGLPIDESSHLRTVRPPRLASLSARAGGDGRARDGRVRAGLLATQLSMDQLALHPMTDSTLNGPTAKRGFATGSGT